MNLFCCTVLQMNKITSLWNSKRNLYLDWYEIELLNIFSIHKLTYSWKWNTVDKYAENALKDCNNKRQFLRIQIFEICAFKQTQIFTAYTGWSKSKALIRNIDNGLGVKLWQHRVKYTFEMLPIANLIWVTL